MNPIPTICEPMLLNRFFDGELDADEAAIVSTHIQTCSACRAFIAQSKTLSVLINDGIQELADLQVLDDLDVNVRHLINKKKQPLRYRFKDVVFWKWSLIPTMAMVGLLFFFLWGPSPAMDAGPSAIVASVEGDVSSLVIMETPDTHQTIIWFKESI